MDDNVGSNALRLVGEVFVPGASQLVSGNIGSGILHNVLAGAAGLALVGTGAAPLLGTLAILAVKLNSYSSATTGRNLWNFAGDAIRQVEPDRTPSRSRTSTPSPASA